MTPAAALRGARRLLAEPAGWTQFTMQRDRSGAPGKCYCLVGAVAATVEEVAPSTFHLRHAAYRFLNQAINPRLKDLTGSDGRIIAFNDRGGRRHATVLRKLDAAIELAEAAEA